MYPIDYEADFNPTPNRATTFFRIILAIPWIIVGAFWGILFLFTHFFAWVAVVILGRYPEWLYNFNSGVIRFAIRFNSWLFLQTDQWPPFGLSDDPTYPIRVNFPPPAAKQSRLKAFFRYILAIPVLFLVAYVVSYVVQLIALGAWLTIVFRGYLPEWMFNTLVHLHSFETRVYSYMAILTDDYPPVGLEKAKGTGAVAQPSADVPQPPPAPAA